MLNDKTIRQRKLGKIQEKEENLQIQFGAKKEPIDLEYGEDGLQHMILNGEDVTAAIRNNEVSAYASTVSAILPKP